MLNTLRIEGRAGSPIWLMEDGTEPATIGLRLDDGNAGVVYFTREQATELRDMLTRYLELTPGEREVSFLISAPATVHFNICIDGDGALLKPAPERFEPLPVCIPAEKNTEGMQVVDAPNSMPQADGDCE